LLDNGASAVRPLSGGEIVQEVWNRLHNGHHTLFLGVEVDFFKNVIKSQVVSASKEAWKRLRYSNPLVASTIDLDSSGTAQLFYRTGNVQTVNQWSDRTFLMHERVDVSLEAVRVEVGSLNIPTAAGDQTMLHFVHDVTGQHSKVGLLFHTHHSSFDGVGVHTLASIYLDHLTQVLCNEGQVLEWGAEIDNLLAPAMDVLEPLEPRPVDVDSTETPSFDNPAYMTIGTLLESNQKAIMNPWGFKPRTIAEGPPTSQFKAILLSKEESVRILDSVRKIQSGRFTYTHLAHAALCMVAITDNPPSPDASSAWLACWGLRNGRSRLTPPYSDQYAGYALGVSHMTIPVSLFIGEDGQVFPMDKALLRRVLNHVNKEYAARDASSVVMGHMDLTSKILVSVLAPGYQANAIPPDHGFTFSSDGVGEKNLEPVRQSSTGQTTLTVSHVFTSLKNVEPGPFFRTASWNNQIMLSADYNANFTSNDDVALHLMRWKQYILMADGI